jgi:hypothetical protein
VLLVIMLLTVTHEKGELARTFLRFGPEVPKPGSAAFGYPEPPA